MQEKRFARVTIEQAIKEHALKEARQETIASVVEFRMRFKRSALFMIRKEYLDLDFSNIDLTQMEGYDVSTPVDGLT